VCTVGWLLLRLLPLRLVSGRRGRHLPLGARCQLECVLAAARDDFTAELNGAARPRAVHSVFMATKTAALLLRSKPHDGWTLIHCLLTGVIGKH